ncbi:MAG: hypothetical protein WC520_01505 [Candidatus Paceibacterota bacterium]
MAKKFVRFIAKTIGLGILAAIFLAWVMALGMEDYAEQRRINAKIKRLEMEGG